MAQFTPIAQLTDVPPGQMKSFNVNGQAILIANWQGTLFATQDLCTHDNGKLGDGELADGAIECPRHGARFDLQTGRGTMPALLPIKTFSIKIQDNQVLVALD